MENDANSRGVVASSNNYETIRKAGPCEVLIHLFHDLGVQSNVLVCAEYCHASKTLTPNRVHRALAKVVGDHPMLGVVGVSLPSAENRDHHQLWEARLASINLKDCVEFWQLDLEDAAFSQFSEKFHNSWFDTEDKTKPWWKLVVTNGTHAAFVWHHLIGDGLSAYAFHQSLLKALNQDEIAEDSDEEGTSVVPVPAKPLPPYLLDEKDGRLNWLYLAKNFFSFLSIRYFISRKSFFFSDAIVSKKHRPTLAKPLPPGERTITKVEILRIDWSIVRESVLLCRKNNTSFTSLLETLIQITLALDIYPKARYGFSRIAVNLRPLLSNYEPNQAIFTNTVCTHTNLTPLKQYRAAGEGAPLILKKSSHPSLNKQLVWKLAEDFKTNMNKSILSGQGLQNFLCYKMLGKDEEEIGKFAGLGMFHNNSFVISNLGKFNPPERMASDNWSVKDVRFSQGQICAALSDFAMAFNVASVKEEDCFITATWQEGVLKGGMVRRVLDGLLARLKLMV